MTVLSMTRSSIQAMRGAKKTGVLAILLAIAFSGASAGSISGSIAAADGAPIDAALTLHDLTTARVAGAHSFDRQFASKRDGTFALSGIPAGRYEICVDAPHQLILDPCRWGTTERITVAAGSAVTGVNLTVRRGYLLRVRVRDPGQILPAAVGGIAGAALQMTVQTREGRYENLRMQGIDATGRTHYLVIPYDRPLLLEASSTGLALSDANNQRYTNDSARIPVAVPSGGSIPVVTFIVAKP
jgi:hypothetical protein